MKLNSTIGLTLILLTSMLVAGIFSAVAGMSVGREALKGITQPDTRPTNNLTNRKGEENRKNSLTILQEDKILATVKARMGGKATAAVPKAVPVAAVKAEAVSKFPLTAESEGVLLEVRSAQNQGDALTLAIALTNETGEPVKFLYTFLEVKDERGQILAASTEGLPAEVPPDATPYSGTVRIPVTAIGNTKTLALALSDYPDQQVQLKLSNIPVTR